MAQFKKGNNLNSTLEEIFENAQKNLIIISPYIKLHSRFKDVLKPKLNEHRLQITIVFGKNEDDISKSFSLEDFNFFKEYPDIEIRYEPRLHAKYYANEESSLLSSMNLYDFSQNNNIEFGILTKNSSSDKLDQEAYEYFKSVIDNGKLLFKNKPIIEEKLLGFSKKYLGFNNVVNELEELLKPNNKPKNTYKPAKRNEEKMGYCIRTGIKIPFNPKRPFSDKAFESWNRFKDDNYQEKFCHFSGESSNGETCFARPILKKNWNLAKNLM